MAAVLDEDDDDDLRIVDRAEPDEPGVVSSFALSAPALMAVSRPTTCAVPVLPPISTPWTREP